MRALDADGKVRVRENPKFHPPAQVDLSIGEARKAREKLGWGPRVQLELFVKTMVRADTDNRCATKARAE